MKDQDRTAIKLENAMHRAGVPSGIAQDVAAKLLQWFDITPKASVDGDPEPPPKVYGDPFPPPPQQDGEAIPPAK